MLVRYTDVIEAIIEAIKRKVNLLIEYNIEPSYFTPLIAQPEVYHHSKYSESIRKKLSNLFAIICPPGRDQCSIRESWIVNDNYIAIDIFVHFGALRVPVNVDFVYLHENDKVRLLKEFQQRCIYDGKVKVMTMYCEVLMSRSILLFEKLFLPPFAIRTNILTLVYWMYRYGFEDLTNKILGKVKEILTSQDVDSIKQATVELIRVVLDEVLPYVGKEYFNQLYILSRIKREEEKNGDQP